jgi:hypothetical protein
MFLSQWVLSTCKSGDITMLDVYDAMPGSSMDGACFMSTCLNPAPGSYGTHPWPTLGDSPAKGTLSYTTPAQPSCIAPCLVSGNWRKNFVHHNRTTRGSHSHLVLKGNTTKQSQGNPLLKICIILTSLLTLVANCCT